MLEDLEDVGELEDEPAGFELLEAEAALGEGFEAGDGDDGRGVREDQGLELEDFPGFLLDFHVVVVAVVAHALELLGYGGGL